MSVNVFGYVRYMYKYMHIKILVAKMLKILKLNIFDLQDHHLNSDDDLVDLNKQF